MAPIIPDEIPSRIVGGTTVKFHRSFGDYPASAGWSYKFYAVGATAKFNVSATTNPDGSSFDIVIPATLTSLLSGRFQCAEELTNSGSGEVVDPNLAQLELYIEKSVTTANAGDFTSHPERTLIIIEAAIEGRLTADMESYMIEGRSIVKVPIKELSRLRAVYARKVWALKNPGRLGATVSVVFNTEPEDPEFPPTWIDVTGLGR